MAEAPPPEVLAWVTGALRAPIVAWSPLPQTDEVGPWRLTLGDDQPPRRAVLALGEPGSDGLATEVAALEVCEAHGIPAPRVLVADPTGAEVGRPALVQSWITGGSSIQGLDDRPRARDLGEVAAAIHAVDLEPSGALPHRRSSLATLPFETLPVPAEAADLFAEVREVVAALPPLAGRSGFVHGDLWQGNTLWDDGGHVGTVDWDHAGVGHPVVDLGSLRWDLAVLSDDDRDETVLAWEEASGVDLDPDVVAYGDLLAVLASPPDLAMWLPNFHAQGAAHLTLEVVTARRDTFARRALRPFR